MLFTRHHLADAASPDISADPCGGRVLVVHTGPDFTHAVPETLTPAEADRRAGEIHRPRVERDAYHAAADEARALELAAIRAANADRHRRWLAACAGLDVAAMAEIGREMDADLAALLAPAA